MELATLIDAFCASYEGRDTALFLRLVFWRHRLGHLPLASITADLVDTEIDHLAQRGALHLVGGEGLIPANRPLSPASLNRYLVSLGTLLTYARRRRLLPRSFVSPVKGVEKQPEPEGRLIYLTSEQVNPAVLNLAYLSQPQH